MNYPTLTSQDRPWNEYPLGTKAHAFMGGFWIRVALGWKWCTGATFPTPGGDAIGQCVELQPPNGTRKLIEMTAGKPEHSRFSVCYWLNGEWCMDDAPADKDRVAERGYVVLAVHDLPQRSALSNQTISIVQTDHPVTSP